VPELAGPDGPEGGPPASSLGPRRADRVELVGLRFLGTHGALPEERRRPQPFEVDLAVVTDLQPAGRSDRLCDTVDYAALCEVVKGVIEGPPVSLLERLAEQVADQVLALAGAGARVLVTVRKPHAPLAAQFASVAVHIERP